MTVIVQAGHLHIENHCTPALRAATGAAGESGWTSAIADTVVSLLLSQGVAARAVDANFTCSDEISEDYGAVIAVHYQGNLPTDSGFFVGTGDPDEDGAAAASAQLAGALRAAYEQATSLVFQPGWNNLGITHHYVFEKLSPATPFCLLESGVGWGADRDFLHSRQGMTQVAKAIAHGVAAFLNQPTAPSTPAQLPIVREHSQDIDGPNVQLHRELTDLNEALHAIAVELSDVRIDRDAARTELKNATQVLTNLAQLVRGSKP